MRRKHWTGQSGILISNTVLANPDDGENTEKKKNGRCIFITLIANLSTQLMTSSFASGGPYE